MTCQDLLPTQTRVNLLCTRPGTRVLRRLLVGLIVIVGGVAVSRAADEVTVWLGSDKCRLSAVERALQVSSSGLRTCTGSMFTKCVKSVVHQIRSAIPAAPTQCGFEIIESVASELAERPEADVSVVEDLLDSNEPLDVYLGLVLAHDEGIGGYRSDRVAAHAQRIAADARISITLRRHAVASLSYHDIPIIGARALLRKEADSELGDELALSIVEQAARDGEDLSTMLVDGDRRIRVWAAIKLPVEDRARAKAILRDAAQASTERGMIRWRALNSLLECCPDPDSWTLLMQQLEPRNWYSDLRGPHGNELSVHKVLAIVLGEKPPGWEGAIAALKGNLHLLPEPDRQAIGKAIDIETPVLPGCATDHP